MVKKVIGLGTTPNDNTGSSLRLGGEFINDNFSEIYTALGTGTALSIDVSGATANQILRYSSGAGKFVPDSFAATYNLFVQGSTGSAQTLNSGDTINLVGGSGINTTTSSSDTVTFSIDNSVTTNTGTQTLTNKTLNSPKINENVVLTSTATELNLLTGVAALLTSSNAVTLTNKTMSGASNTFSSIPVTAIGNGIISNTEFEYLDGLTDNIQAQLYSLSIALGS